MNLLPVENLLILMSMTLLQMEGFASQGVPYTPRNKVLPKRFAVKNMKRPSLAAALKILQPEKITTVHGSNRIIKKQTAKPSNPKVILEKTKFAIPKGYHQPNPGTYFLKSNAPARRAPLVPQLKKTTNTAKMTLQAAKMLKMQQIRRLAVQRQMLKANNRLKGKTVKAAVGNFVGDPSTKRQKLWYPGDQAADPVQKLSLQNSLQTAFPINEKPMYVTEMQNGPGRSLNTKLILSKLHNNRFRPHETLPQTVRAPASRANLPVKRVPGMDSKGYVNTMSLLLHHDDVNADFNLGGTTLRSPYAAISYKPGDYFGPVMPQNVIEEQGYVRSIKPNNQPAATQYDLTTPRMKQSTIASNDRGANDLPLEKNTEQRGSFTDVRQGRPLMAANFKSDSEAKYQENGNERSSGKRVVSSSFEKVDTDNNENGVHYNENDQKWEKMQKEREERWRQYQHEREERWRDLSWKTQNNGNAAARHIGMGAEQEPSNDERHHASVGGSYRQELGSQNERSSNAENAKNYNVQYFSNGLNTYDYKTDKQFTSKGLNQTEELSPMGGSIGNIQMSLEKGQQSGGKDEFNIGNQSKIVNLEVVDKPDSPAISSQDKQPNDSENGNEPGKGGVPVKGGPQVGELGNSGPPGKGEVIEKVGPPEKAVVAEEEKETSGEKKPGPQESLLDRMEQKLASILSLMEYSGGIHTIEIVSSGCDDPPASGEDCNKAMGTISLDGEQLSNDEIGFNIVVLDYPSFKLSKVKTFDTNTDSAKSQKLASFLMSLQETSIILVAVKGDIAGAVGQDVWDTLTLFGARAPFEKRRRSSFAFIGCRGDCQLPWIQQVQRPAGQGPSSIHVVIGASKEYVSFGGGGPVVNDALKTADKGTSMSEGYNAGLPSRLAPTKATPERVSQPVPYSAQELVSSQEIIKDVDGMRAQKEAATYLNRQEAGEVGLGREVPMQKANLLSPYGRELRYQGSNQANIEAARGKGNWAGQIGLEGKSSNHLESKVSSDEHQDIDRIPTEAESDNEPFPEDAMSIANQLNPTEIASAGKQQLGQQGIKEQGANKINNVNDMKLGLVSRFGHTSKGGNDNKQESLGREESTHDSKSREMFQPHDMNQSQGAKMKTSSASQHADRGKMAEEMKYEKGQEIIAVRPDASNEKNDQEGNKNSKYYKNSGNQEAETPTGGKVEYDSKFDGDFRNAALQRMGSQNNKGLPENEIQKPGIGLYRENSSNMDFQNGKYTKEKTSYTNRNTNEVGDHQQIGQNDNLDKGESNTNRAYQHVTGSEFPKTGGRFSPNGEEERFGTAQKSSGNQNGVFNGQQYDHSDTRGDPCKHCDIHPEVTYKLESSDVEAGPSKCKGCGPNPKLVPVVENLGLNMTVSDKLVSPQLSQAMKTIEVPQTKGDITDKGQFKPKVDFENVKNNGNIDDHGAGQQGTSQEYNGLHHKYAQHDYEALNSQGISSDHISSQRQSALNVGGNSDEPSAPYEGNGLRQQGGSPERSAPGGQSPSSEQSKSQGQSISYRQSQSQEQASQKEQQPPYASSQTNEFEGTNKAIGQLMLTKNPNDKALSDDHFKGGNLLSYTSNSRDESTRPKVERQESDLSRKVTNGNTDENAQKARKPDQSFKDETSRLDNASQRKEESEASSSRSNKTEGANVGTAENGQNHEFGKERNDEKPTNITTLVEIISKGMKALRESNFDIGGHPRKDSNDLTKNSRDEGKDTKDSNDRKENDSKKEGNDVKMKPANMQNGFFSAPPGAPKPENFPIALKPEHVVSQMQRGNHESNMQDGDNVGKVKPLIQSPQSNRRFDADGNFSEDSLEFPKHAWHESSCANNPDLCKGGGQSSDVKVTGQSHEPNENSKQFKRPTNGDKSRTECATFFNLPDRQKRKLPKHKLERLKRNCMPHHQNDVEPLNVPDIKNEDVSAGEKPKNNEALLSTGQKTSTLDKLNLNAAKVKIASLLSQETPEKTAPPGFHPGYTTMAFEHGAVIPEKKLDAMPDTSETFVSKTERPDFSPLPGESSVKNPDMAYYFNHKNDQKEKDMLMRALPDTTGAAGAITNLNSPYDQGNVYQIAENLLQKDYAMAYKEASTALNQRVANEQKLLNDNKISILAKRRLKKPSIKQPAANIKRKH